MPALLISADAHRGSLPWKAPVPALPFKPGDICGDRYRIIRVIDVGGASILYEAQSLVTQQPVALKALSDETGVGEAGRRLLLEVKALGKIHHKNLVRVFDGGIVGHSVVWTATELLEGEGLRRWIHRHGRPDLSHAISLCLQIAQGVKAAHDAGVMHRDLKPDNVFVISKAAPGEEIRVLDFGTARVQRSDLGTPNRLRIVGSYACMPPERLQFNLSDRRGDVFALGHIIYELLTGRHCLSHGPGPWDFPRTYQLGLEQLTVQPVSTRIHRADIPEPLDVLVLQMLSKSADRRPKSMSGVIEQLEGILRDLKPSSPARSEHSEAASPSVPGAQLDVPQRRWATLRSSPPALQSHPADADLDRPQEIWTASTHFEQPWTDPIAASGEPVYSDTHRLRRPNAANLSLRVAERPAPVSADARFLAGALRVARLGTEAHELEHALLNMLAREPSDASILETLELAWLGLLGDDGNEPPAEDLARVRNSMLWGGHPHSLRPRIMGVLCLREFGEQRRQHFPAPFVADGREAQRLAQGAALLLPDSHRDPRILPALAALNHLTRDDRALFELAILALCTLPSEDQTALQEDLMGFVLGPSLNNTARSLLGEWIVRCNHSV